MVRLVIILFLFCFALMVNGQDINEYAVDAAARAIPREETNTTADIAQYIGKHFDTDDKKVRAAYAWVTTNIKYDKDSIHRVILDESREEKVTFALRRRKGVCENFAAIFNDICIKSGIPSFVIEGYSTQNGNINKEPHAWCAARIGGNWFLFDPTWDAGFTSSGGLNKARYFKILPVDFIQTHYPFDPLFQFLNYPLNYHEFSRNVSSGKTYFNFTDSLKAYQDADSLTRYLSALARIEKNEWPETLIDIKKKQIKLEIELIYQDSDMSDYNSAINDYNQAIGNLNTFLNYRNNQFQPPKKEEEVQGIFNEIKRKINLANLKLNRVNQSKATLALNTGDIQKKLDDLVENVKQQQTFWKDSSNSRLEK